MQGKTELLKNQRTRSSSLRNANKPVENSQIGNLYEAGKAEDLFSQTSTLIFKIFKFIH